MIPQFSVLVPRDEKSGRVREATRNDRIEAPAGETNGGGRGFEHQHVSRGGREIS